MSDLIAPLRGMKDIYFTEYDIFRYIENQAHKIAEIYGYQGLKTPILEATSVFQRTLGETSDVVSKEIYNFADKKGRSIALRPEFTAGVMRAVLSNKLCHKLPLKLFSCGPLFRYDRPQEGRQRQFHQLNFEYIGKKSPYIDAEIISCADQLLANLGVKDHLTLELNSLGCALSRQRYQEALVEYFSKYKSDLSEDSQNRLEKNPLRILDSKDKKDKEITALAPHITEFYTAESAQYFAKLKMILEELGIKYSENSRLVRGLDYYSDTIFEYTTTKLGAQATVLAGGRYDGLAEIMGGNALPAIGFAAGFERIMLMREFTIDKLRPVYIFPMDDTSCLVANKLLQNLRKHQIVSSIISEGKINKRIQAAIADNARYAIFIGQSELDNDCYTVKDLDTQTEQKLGLNQLLSITLK